MGFEPMVPLWGTLTFQASTFDLSVTSPKKCLRGTNKLINYSLCKF
jgi:hypothetical protein